MALHPHCVAPGDGGEGPVDRMPCHSQDTRTRARSPWRDSFGAVEDVQPACKIVHIRSCALSVPSSAC
jgi:hypothetical protein